MKPNVSIAYNASTTEEGEILDRAYYKFLVTTAIAGKKTKNGSTFSAVLTHQDIVIHNGKSLSGKFLVDVDYSTHKSDFVSQDHWLKSPHLKVSLSHYFEKTNGPKDLCLRLTALFNRDYSVKRAWSDYIIKKTDYWRVDGGVEQMNAGETVRLITSIAPQMQLVSPATLAND